MHITWKKELASGNALIDTQHRMLMLLCHKLDIAIKTGQSEHAIQRTLLELKKFAEFHFVSEENLMHEIGYPDVEKHAFIHTDLLMRLNELVININHHKEHPDDLLKVLNTWLVGHIMHEDSKIAQLVQHTDNRPIGEGLYEQFLRGM